MVDCGRINEWDDVEKKRIELDVPAWSEEMPGPWVVVDMAHNPTDVHEQCAKYRWFALLGQDTDEFLHSSRSQWEGQRLLYSEERWSQPGFGTSEGVDQRMVACYYLFAKQKVEDILAALRSGKAEAWESPRDIEQFCPEYAEHLASHHQILESTKNGDRLMWRGIGHAPDHLLDCEIQLVVPALMGGIFKR
jgi:hypothetical protein